MIHSDTSDHASDPDYGPLRSWGRFAIGDAIKHQNTGDRGRITAIDAMGRHRTGGRCIVLRVQWGDGSTFPVLADLVRSAS